MALPPVMGPSGYWQSAYGLDFTSLTQAQLQAETNSGWFSKGWSTPTSGGGSAPNNLNWFSPQLATVQADGLHLACSATSASIGGVSYPRGAAMVQSSGFYTFSIPAGGMVAQIQARWPTLTSVSGSWPAWWLLSEANSAYGPGPYPWPPEIDLLEWNPPQGHVQGINGQSPAFGTATGDYSQALHTRTVLISAAGITTWMDGVQLADTYTSPALAAYLELDLPWYWLLNSSVNSLKSVIPSDFVVANLQFFTPSSAPPPPPPPPPPPAPVTYNGTLKGSDGSTLTLSGTLSAA